jgi:DNA-binding transcriptional LysR family regulator
VLPTNVDLDALRTLTLAQDLGGFGRAADQLRKTPSAISLQMKRLQEQVGVPLFLRRGRRTILTEQGEIAVRYARRVLALNDEMLDTLHGASLSGVVRIGFAQDFVETILPHALAQFSSFYPLVRLEVKVDRNASLLNDLDAGKLDVALVLGEARRSGIKIGELPLCWIASKSFSARPIKPLPLILFEEPCIFRTRALDALDRAGIPWRVAMTSPSVAGLWAAVDGGLGITVRARTGAPAQLHFAPQAMPELGTMDITLYRRSSAKSAPVQRFAEITKGLALSCYGSTAQQAAESKGSSR